MKIRAANLLFLSTIVVESGSKKTLSFLIILKILLLS